MLDRPGLKECDVTSLLPVLALARFELGRVKQAAKRVEQALTIFRRLGARRDAAEVEGSLVVLGHPDPPGG